MTSILETRRELFFLLLAVFGLATAVIWIRTATVKATYAYVEKEKEYRKLQQEIQATRVRWLKLTTPKRLEALARNLGLRPPEMSQMLRYEVEKKVGDHATR